MSRFDISAQHPGDIVNINGVDYIYLGNGTFSPTISGGDGTAAEPTLADIMALLKKQEGSIAAIQEERKGDRQQFDELVDAIANAVDNGGGEGDDTDDEPATEPVVQPRATAATANDNNDVQILQRQLAKMSKQMEEMQKVIEQRETAASDERELRLASQRDSLLQNALTEAGVLPNAMDAALKLFRDNVAYDDENDAFWFIEDKTGVKLQINEGIKDNMPDYLKASQIQRGGSGGRGSQSTALLEQAKKNLSELHDKARRSGAEADIAAYHTAKKKVLDLEGARKGSTPADSPEGSRPPVATSGVVRTGTGRPNRETDTE